MHRRGRRRLYDGKVNLLTRDRFDWVKTLEDGTEIYTAVVWSVSLKRLIRLAYLYREETGKSCCAVLFSTDTQIDPYDLYRFYKARFQIEFIFRDARQFTGLADCQARCPEALDAHVNASLTALNLAKAALNEHRLPGQAFSIASFKRLAFNEYLLNLFISKLDLDLTLIKSHPNYQEILRYGEIAS